MEGDLASPQSLATAMKGVGKLYLVSGTHGGIDPELEGNAIVAAKAQGVKHVVKLSVVGAEAPFDTFGKLHAGSEARLRESGLAWTMIRPHYFMTNILRSADTIRSQGAFYQPTGEGRYAAVDPLDIAAVAVKALTEPGHENRAYTLSGPEALSAAQYAAKLSGAIGKPVRFVDVPPEAARAGLLKSGGMPSVHVEALMDLLAVMKAGKLDVVADGVSEVTGRAATSFDDWARRNAAAFQ